MHPFVLEMRGTSFGSNPMFPSCLAGWKPYGSPSLVPTRLAENSQATREPPAVHDIKKLGKIQDTENHENWATFAIHIF